MKVHTYLIRSLLIGEVIDEYIPIRKKLNLKFIVAHNSEC